MNPQQVQDAYELITNPILRLLVYFLSAAVIGLTSAVIYLHRELRSDQQERLNINREAIKGYEDVATGLQHFESRIAALEERIITNLLKQ